MAAAFNLVAELTLRGPTNVRQVVNNLNRQLAGVKLNIQITKGTQTRLNSLQKSAQQLNSVFQNVSKNAAAARASLSSMAASAKQVSTGLKGTQNALSGAAAGLQQVSKEASIGGNAMMKFGLDAGQAARRFLAFSIPVTIMFKLVSAISEATGEAIKFDRELIRIAQVARTTKRGLSGLVSEVRNLATGFGVSSADLLEQARILKQTGLSIRDTTTAMRALAKASLAPTFTDMANTAEGAVAMMRQFGISADELKGKLGSINAVAAQFAVEAQDIMFAIRRTGGVFEAAGGNVEQLISLFTSIRAKTRESAETIATGLRTIFTRIQRPKTIDMLKELGINLRNARGEFIGGYEAIKVLGQAIEGLDSAMGGMDIRRSETFFKIAEQLGGYRQIGKVIPLLTNWRGAEEALQVAQKGRLSIDRDALKAQQALAVQFSKTKEEFLKLIAEFTETNTFKEMIRSALMLAKAFIGIASALKEVLPLIAAVGAFKFARAGIPFARGAVSGLSRISSTGPNTMKGLSGGGSVGGSGNFDSVPAMLTPGEFVVRKKAVQNIGVNNLRSMNQIGGYASGGVVTSGRRNYGVAIGPGGDPVLTQGNLSNYTKLMNKGDPVAANAYHNKIMQTSPVAQRHIAAQRTLSNVYSPQTGQPAASTSTQSLLRGSQQAQVDAMTPAQRNRMQNRLNRGVKPVQTRTGRTIPGTGSFNESKGFFSPTDAAPVGRKTSLRTITTFDGQLPSGVSRSSTGALVPTPTNRTSGLGQRMGAGLRAAPGRIGTGLRAAPGKAWGGMKQMGRGVKGAMQSPMGGMALAYGGGMVGDAVGGEGGGAISGASQFGGTAMMLGLGGPATGAVALAGAAKGYVDAYEQGLMEGAQKTLGTAGGELQSGSKEFNTQTGRFSSGQAQRRFTSGLKGSSKGAGEYGQALWEQQGIMARTAGAVGGGGEQGNRILADTLGQKGYLGTVAAGLSHVGQAAGIGSGTQAFEESAQIGLQQRTEEIGAATRDAADTARQYVETMVSVHGMTVQQIKDTQEGAAAIRAIGMGSHTVVEAQARGLKQSQINVSARAEGEIQTKKIHERVMAAKAEAQEAELRRQQEITRMYQEAQAQLAQLIGKHAAANAAMAQYAINMDKIAGVTLDASKATDKRIDAINRKVATATGQEYTPAFQIEGGEQLGRRAGQITDIGAYNRAAGTALSQMGPQGAAIAQRASGTASVAVNAKEEVQRIQKGISRTTTEGGTSATAGQNAMNQFVQFTSSLPQDLKTKIGIQLDLMAQDLINSNELIKDGTEAMAHIFATQGDKIVQMIEQPFNEINQVVSQSAADFEREKNAELQARKIIRNALESDRKESVQMENEFFEQRKNVFRARLQGEGRAPMGAAQELRFEKMAGNFGRQNLRGRGLIPDVGRVSPLRNRLQNRNPKANPMNLQNEATNMILGDASVALKEKFDLLALGVDANAPVMQQLNTVIKSHIEQKRKEIEITKKAVQERQNQIREGERQVFQAFEGSAFSENPAMQVNQMRMAGMATGVAARSGGNVGQMSPQARQSVDKFTQMFSQVRMGQFGKVSQQDVARGIGKEEDLGRFRTGEELRKLITFNFMRRAGMGEQQAQRAVKQQGQMEPADKIFLEKWDAALREQQALTRAVAAKEAVVVAQQLQIIRQTRNNLVLQQQNLQQQQAQLQQEGGGRRPVGRANGGIIPRRFSQGNIVPVDFSAQGTDTVPAMLSPGEYVVQSSAVNQYGEGFLGALNAGMVRRGGMIPKRFQAGGAVRDSGFVNDPKQFGTTDAGGDKQPHIKGGYASNLSPQAQGNNWERLLGSYIGVGPKRDGKLLKWVYKGVKVRGEDQTQWTGPLAFQAGFSNYQEGDRQVSLPSLTSTAANIAMGSHSKLNPFITGKIGGNLGGEGLNYPSDMQGKAFRVLMQWARNPNNKFKNSKEFPAALQNAAIIAGFTDNEPMQFDGKFGIPAGITRWGGSHGIQKRAGDTNIVAKRGAAVPFRRGGIVAKKFQGGGVTSAYGSPVAFGKQQGIPMLGNVPPGAGYISQTGSFGSARGAFIDPGIKGDMRFKSWLYRGVPHRESPTGFASQFMGPSQFDGSRANIPSGGVRILHNKQYQASLSNMLKDNGMSGIFSNLRGPSLGKGIWGANFNQKDRRQSFGRLLSSARNNKAVANSPTWPFGLIKDAVIAGYGANPFNISELDKVNQGLEGTNIRQIGADKNIKPKAQVPGGFRRGGAIKAPVPGGFRRGGAVKARRFQGGGLSGGLSGSSRPPSIGSGMSGAIESMGAIVGPFADAAYMLSASLNKFANASPVMQLSAAPIEVRVGLDTGFATLGDSIQTTIQGAIHDYIWQEINTAIEQFRGHLNSGELPSESGGQGGILVPGKRK